MALHNSLSHFKTTLTNGIWKAISVDNSLSTTAYDKLFLSFHKFSSHVDLWFETLQLLDIFNCKKEGGLLLFCNQEILGGTLISMNEDCDSTGTQKQHTLTRRTSNMLHLGVHSSYFVKKIREDESKRKYCCRCICETVKFMETSVW